MTNRSAFTNSPDAEFGHAERVAQLSPIRQALGRLLQLEIEHEFGTQDAYHRILNDGIPARALAHGHVYATLLARPADDALEVRAHLPENLPAPAVTCPLASTSPGGRKEVIVYHFRPERMRHLQELIDVLKTARSEAA